MSETQVERERCPACDGMGLRPVDGDPGAYHFFGEDAECPWCEGDGTLPAKLVALLKDKAEEFGECRKALALCRTELAYLIEQLPSRGFGISSVQKAHAAASAVLDG